MMVNLSDDVLAAMGAKTPAEFSSKLAELVTASQTKSIMAEQTTNFETLEKRIAALEGAKPLTEARVSELMTASLKPALSDWAASVEGKQLIGAEASRITAAALAAVGTNPAKPTPANAELVEAADRIAALEKGGKFEEAYALLPAADRGQFLGPKSYGAFRRAQMRGQVRLG